MPHQGVRTTCPVGEGTTKGHGNCLLLFWLTFKNEFLIGKQRATKRQLKPCVILPPRGEVHSLTFGLVLLFIHTCTHTLLFFFFYKNEAMSSYCFITCLLLLLNNNICEQFSISLFFTSSCLQLRLLFFRASLKPWWFSGWEPAYQCRTPMWTLTWEYPTCHGATKPVGHSY